MTSQINPNDINGDYPVAGVSNNTQGMRDNFTNIKTNFQYAEDEINDLQLKGVFKAALTGTTLDNNMADNLIYAAKIQDFSATQVLVAAPSGSIAIDYSAGHYQTIAISGNISLSFTNFPAAGSVGMLRLQIIVDVANRTMTLPTAVSLGTTGVQGYSGNVITFAAAGTFEFGFVTSNAGTTITLFDLNRPLSYYTNPVTIAATTASTSNITGALTVLGGVGIGGNLYAAGNVNAVGLSLNGNVIGNLNVTGNIIGANLTAISVVSSPQLVTNKIKSDDSSFVSIEDGLSVEQGLEVAGNISLSGNVISALKASTTIAAGTTMSAVGNIDGGNLRTVGQVSATGNITSAGFIRSSSNVQGIGYATGAGANVVQSFSRTSTVSINAVCGSIVLVAAAGIPFLQTFTVSNNRILVTDVIALSTYNGVNNYVFWVNAQFNGGFQISFYAPSGSSVDQPIINFAVIRSSQS
jgi:cytoskeletal protein CcmA (bactofilin family)